MLTSATERTNTGKEERGRQTEAAQKADRYITMQTMILLITGGKKGGNKLCVDQKVLIPKVSKHESLKQRRYSLGTTQGTVHSVPLYWKV